MLLLKAPASHLPPLLCPPQVRYPPLHKFLPLFLSIKIALTVKLVESFHPAVLSPTVSGIVRLRPAPLMYVTIVKTANSVDSVVTFQIATGILSLLHARALLALSVMVACYKTPVVLLRTVSGILTPALVRCLPLLQQCLVNPWLRLLPNCGVPTVTLVRSS